MLKKLFIAFYCLLGLLSAWAQDYSVVPVKTIPLNAKLVLGGKIIFKPSTVISAKMSGRISTFDGKAGDLIKKGESLLTFDQSSLKAEMSRIYEQITLSKESLKESEAQYIKSISPAEFSDAVSDKKTALTSDFEKTPLATEIVKKSDAYDKIIGYYTQYVRSNKLLNDLNYDLDEVKKRFERSVVTAPFSGVLLKKLKQAGDQVSEGEALAEFVDNEKMQLLVDVPVNVAFNLKKGESYSVYLHAPYVLTSGKFVHIEPMANHNNHTVAVKFELAENHNAMVGSYAEVVVLEQAAREKIMVIPESTIVWLGSLPSVYVVDRNDKLSLKFIRLAEKVNDKEYAVLSGLNNKDRLIDNPGALYQSRFKLN